MARLAYLDAPMAMFVAAAMYCGWRWQETWSWRWVAATGAAAGLAVGTKLPALFLALALLKLVAPRSDASRRRRWGQYLAVCSVAAITALVTWLPLGRDLPRAIRFMGAMQARSVDQSLEVAGRTYSDAPVWTQLWWQWDAWPAFAAVQLLALVAVWWLLPRRPAAFVVSCVLLPMIAFALGGRILPHWQVTWQPAMAVLVGVTIVGLTRTCSITLTRGSRLRGNVARALSVAAALVVLAHAGARLHGTLTSEVSDQMRVAQLLQRVDEPHAWVHADQAGGSAAARAIVDGRSVTDGTYHSAAENQHGWVTRHGDRPRESGLSEAVAVAYVGRAREGAPAPSAVIPDFSDWTRHRAGRFDVWIHREERRTRCVRGGSMCS